MRGTGDQADGVLARARNARGGLVDRRRLSLPAVVAVLALTACAPESAESTASVEEGETAAAEPTEERPPEESPEPDAEESEGLHPDEDVLVADVDEPVEFEECTEAEQDSSAAVTWLEDVVISEKTFPGVETETVQFEGGTLEVPGAPAIVIPERVGQAGCIIEYSAPGGCLPAVEISRAFIPGYVLPERALPAVELPDGTVLEEMGQEAVEVAAVEIDRVRAEEICQDEEGDLQPGDIVWSVTRWSETRWSETQWSETQWSETRWSENIDGVRTPTMTLPTYSSETMHLPTVVVPTETLETYRLEGSENTERIDDDNAVSYVTEGDVLFDSDEYRIRSDAEPELEAVAADIADRADDYLIEVEGHTDDLPTSSYDDNRQLSELRARSVAEWLIGNAGVDEELITVEGLGEDYPRADNRTEEGRQLNRRVVITVKSTDQDESGADYELEDSEPES
ncbi:OmpA family protein [Nesterenkonia sphaerica]|uniref:OmpA family protein n=1 Tax=Nesterenkonia sphaerica TaxID=1804988 RepID=A0A5R9AAW5_9MICC|nr:OmpA family protein [Nesterenkonia sphaerica]TLP75793.1 OmpA family protein [Nesterenkonia sphaerica]